MNNDAGNNFNPNVGNNGPVVDPVQNGAAANLMGGQGGPVNSNIMEGQTGVVPTPGAFQGVSDVPNQPDMNLGATVNPVPEANVMPGQENSGVNAFTMQAEPQPSMPNVEPSVPNANPIVDTPAMPEQGSAVNPTLDNTGVIDMPTMNSAPENPVPESPALNNALLGGAAPVNTDLNAGNINDPMNSGMAPANDMPSNDFQVPGANDMNNQIGAQPMDANTAPTDNMSSTDFQMPGVPNMNNQIGDQNMQPMNNNEPNNFGMANGMNNPAPMQQPMNNNIIGDNSMQNNIGQNNGMGGNQIGDMGSMNNNPVPDANQNQDPNNGYDFQQEKKFPLSVREIVLVSIAIVGIVVVIGMYGFGWFS